MCYDEPLLNEKEMKTGPYQHEKALHKEKFIPKKKIMKRKEKKKNEVDGKSQTNTEKKTKEACSLLDAFHCWFSCYSLGKIEEEISFLYTFDKVTYVVMMLVENSNKKNRTVNQVTRVKPP